MADRIPPDSFPSPSNLSGADCSPDKLSAPLSAIFDAPSHVAIINQEWIVNLLGVLDELLYSDVWESTDAERAYNEILQLQAMLMTPANYLIPTDTFQNIINVTGLPLGALQNTLFVVPPGKRYKLTAIQIQHLGATNYSLNVQGYHSGKITPFIFEYPAGEFLTYTWSGDFWLYPGDQIRYVINNSTAGGNVRVSASGLVYSEA